MLVKASRPFEAAFPIDRHRFPALVFDPRHSQTQPRDLSVYEGCSAHRFKFCDLVDQLGDLDDSILVAAEMAGIKGKPKIVKKEKKVPFLEYFKEETASWFSEVVTRGLDRSRMSLQYRY